MKKFIPILAYHSLDPDRFAGKLAITPELFKKQMYFLKRKNFRTPGLEFCAREKGMEGLWEKYAAITFDDGYLDNYEKAFPVLKEFGFAASFFVTATEIGKPGFMSWEMIQTMAYTPGIEIGSHTLSHRPLTDIPEEEAWEAIVSSKKILEERLGKAVKAISYPSGAFNEKILEMVEHAGYQYGCAASHVHDRKFLGNPFLLRRIKISSSSNSDFAFSLRLSGFYHFFGRP